MDETSDLKHDHTEEHGPGTHSHRLVSPPGGNGQRARRSHNLAESVSSRDQLMALLEITRSLTAETDLDHLLQLIVDKTTSLLRADRTTLYLVDFERGEIWSKIGQGLEAREIRIPLGHGLAGYVAQTGKIVNIQDAYNDDRFDSSFDVTNNYQTKTMLVMPMKTQSEEIIGVIQVINKFRASFTANDEAILSALSSSAAIAIENAQLQRELRLMFDSFINTMAATIDARDRQTAGHSQRVSTYSVVMARQLTLPSSEIAVIRFAALLHDFGKIAIPEAVLTKPGKLTDEEYEIMKTHVVKTRDILQNMYFTRGFRQVPIIAAQHHERLDGRGYPDGLTGNQLTLGGRVLGIADCFDALTHNRYYRNAMSYDDAYEYMRKFAGQQFDENVLEALGASLKTPAFLEVQETGPSISYLSSDAER